MLNTPAAFATSIAREILYLRKLPALGSSVHVPKFCAILPDRHSATFRRHEKKNE